MRRADRLFQIVQLLRRRRVALTARQVAERLGISERTVYRDWTYARAWLARELGEDG